MSATKERVLVTTHEERRLVYRTRRDERGRIHGRCNVGGRFGHCIYDDKNKRWVLEK